MPWKVDENGVLAVGEDGNPIVVSDTGKETPVDYAKLMRQLSEAHKEIHSHKERLREYEAKFSLLAEAGVEDIPAFLAEARQAMEMAKNAPDSAKDFEEQLKNRMEAVTSSFNAKLEAKEKDLVEKEKTIAEITDRYRAVTVKFDVLNSKLINERIRPEVRTFIQRELMRSGTVGEDGKVIYRKDDGEVIYGDDGSPAGADDAAIKLMKALGVDPTANLLSLDVSSGSGATSSVPFRGAQIKNPWAKDSWNVTAQMEFYQKNPAEAAGLMQAARQSVPAGL